MYDYMISDDEIIVVFSDGLVKTVTKDEDDCELYDQACEFCLNGDNEEKIRQLLSDESLQNFADKVVSNEIVNINGNEVKGRLASVIMKHYKEGQPVEYLKKFVENLYQNPSYRVVNQLYDFIEASNKNSGGFTIDTDGCIIAYKRVTSDFKDIHTHTFDNSPGAVVEMPRNQVNEDENQTCSSGLHFCAFNYLQHFGNEENDKIIIVKVNPKDVVSIPVDYNNAKARCCRYQVLEEYKGPGVEPVQKKAVSVYTNADELRVENGQKENSGFEQLVKKIIGIPTEPTDINVQMSIYGNLFTDEVNALWNKSNSEICKLHNDLIDAFIPGKLNKPSKFRDKATAIRRMNDLVELIEKIHGNRTWEIK